MKDLIGYYDFLEETQHIVSTAELVAKYLEDKLKDYDFKKEKYPYDKLSRMIRNQIILLFHTHNNETHYLSGELISDIAEFVTPFLKDLIEEWTKNKSNKTLYT